MQISVIVPTFNSERTIERCLKSLSGQVFKGFEVVIMDGGSTDNTLNICLMYEKCFPLSLFSKKDDGIYDAMNKGIRLAKGRWLYFLGSDDILHSDDVFETAMNSVNDHTKLLYGRAFIIPNNTITELDYTFEKLIKWNICHQAIFYSKEVFHNRSYNYQTYPALADWDLNLRIFAEFPPESLRSIDKIICTFSNTGTSSDWVHSSEYKNYFSSGAKIFFRYLDVINAVIRSARFVKQFGISAYIETPRN